MFKNLNSGDFRNGYSSDQNAVIIDVRSQGEIMQGMIPNAMNINLMDPSFRDKIDSLDRNKSYYVYCRSGGRSSSAAGFMNSLGFTKVFNLAGGIMSWDGEVVLPK